MDRISALPQETIEKILTLMPLRDALRTSILSRKWRYCWTTMPKLEFNVLNVPPNSEEFNIDKIIKDIFQVLLLHKGPILEFSISMNGTEIAANEIDPIILHLSRRNSIKKFHFKKRPNRYRLPFSFFSLQGLDEIFLMGCEFKPPLILNGFCMLKRLCLHSCMITVKTLQRFLTKCPLIEEFTLVLLDPSDNIRIKMCAFVELFKCLSSVHVLKMCKLWIMDFGVGRMPKELPTPLVHLRILALNVCFLQQDEISCVLCVINSSPILEKLNLEMCWDHETCVVIDFKNMFDIEDHRDLNSDHLKELEITSFHNVTHEMEFVKLIMAKSPVLKLARLKLNPNVSADEEFKMFQDLVRLPFPRASPAANLIIERMPDMAD